MSQFYKLKYILIVLFIFLTVFPFYISGKTDRSPFWAVPVSLKGVKNFYKVDKFLYRGSQPTKEGFINLKNIGIKTIINLRNFHSDVKIIKGLGFKYIPIGLNTWRKPVFFYIASMVLTGLVPLLLCIE